MPNRFGIVLYKEGHNASQRIFKLNREYCCMIKYFMYPEAK